MNMWLDFLKASKLGLLTAKFFQLYLYIQNLEGLFIGESLISYDRNVLVTSDSASYGTEYFILEESKWGEIMNN